MILYAREGDKWSFCMVVSIAPPSNIIFLMILIRCHIICFYLVSFSIVKNLITHYSSFDKFVLILNFYKPQVTTLETIFADDPTHISANLLDEYIQSWWGIIAFGTQRGHVYLLGTYKIVCINVCMHVYNCVHNYIYVKLHV